MWIMELLGIDEYLVSRKRGKEMKRVEENQDVIDLMRERAECKPAGTYEEMVVFQLGAIATMLADISKSLAVIADKVESEVK